MHYTEVGVPTLLSLFIVISVFHFPWSLTGTGWQHRIQTQTQKINPSALLSSWKSMCVFLFVCQLHCRDVSSCVLREWITSFVTLGPWSGGSSWLHGPELVSVGPLEQCSTRTFSCWWFWHQWVHSTQYDWGHVEGEAGWWPLNSPRFCEWKFLTFSTQEFVNVFQNCQCDRC